MSSIGKSFTTPCTIFEDNQGTIKLVRTQSLTDIVHHHDFFLRGTFVVSYSKTALMLVDCCTKHVNGAQLFMQISVAIGVHFYPDPTQQHYVDLELYNFSWLSRMPSTT
jgi:hypothetical protein